MFRCRWRILALRRVALTHGFIARSPGPRRANGETDPRKHPEGIGGMDSCRAGLSLLRRLAVGGSSRRLHREHERASDAAGANSPSPSRRHADCRATRSTDPRADAYGESRPVFSHGGALGTASATPPTHVTAFQHPGVLNPCPYHFTDGGICIQTDLALQSTADPTTWFRVYEGWTGEGPGPLSCPEAQRTPDLKSGAEPLVLETKPGARSAQLRAEASIGGGSPAC